jgi:hypothetical protein
MLIQGEKQPELNIGRCLHSPQGATSSKMQKEGKEIF